MGHNKVATPLHKGESADHTLMSAGEKYQGGWAVWLYGWNATQQTALPGSKARKTYCLSV